MSEDNNQPEHNIEEPNESNLENFSETKGEKTTKFNPSTLDIIKDVPVTLAVEIGKAKLNIQDLLKLNHGSVVKLSRLVGEPLDVNVNGVLVAKGDVVVIDDNLGVRLTEVISTEKRAESVKS